MATVPGLSDFGTLQQNGGPRGIAKAHDAPGFIVLQSYNGAGVLFNNYLWCDSDGVLRISQTVPTNQDDDGTVVGSQA